MIESGKAPGIELSGADGARFSLAEQLAKGPVALVFFKISCPTCQFTLPFLQRLYAAGSPGSPFLIGISQDQAEPTRDFSRHFGLQFPVMLDSALENYPVSNAYRVTNVPTLFLVEPDGQIAWSLNGFDRAELDRLGSVSGARPSHRASECPLRGLVEVLRTKRPVGCIEEARG